MKQEAASNLSGRVSEIGWQRADKHIAKALVEAAMGPLTFCFLNARIRWEVYAVTLRNIVSKKP